MECYSLVYPLLYHPQKVPGRCLHMNNCPLGTDFAVQTVTGALFHSFAHSLLPSLSSSVFSRHLFIYLFIHSFFFFHLPVALVQRGQYSTKSVTEQRCRGCGWTDKRDRSFFSCPFFSHQKPVGWLTFTCCYFCVKPHAVLCS